MNTCFAVFLLALNSLPSIGTAVMSGVEEVELRIRHVL